MKPRRKSIQIPGTVLYSIGILIGLALSGWCLWGEVESALLVFRTGEGGLTMRCPLMVTVNETGIVSASFDNPTEEVISPTVQAVISHKNMSRTETMVVNLEPGEKKQLQWAVNSDDMIFGGLILVNVFETSQRNFPSHQGSCGVPVARFPGLSGKQVFILMFVTSLIGMAVGAALWVTGSGPLKGLMENATNAGAALAVLVFLDLLLTLPRWWGLSMLIFFIAVMLIFIIFTQFVLFPTKTDRGER